MRTDLLKGNILKALVAMALPVMATSLLQMAYNMTDMIWIGRVGSNSVAAVGASGMFVSLASSFTAFLRVGGQVNVAHAFGAGKNDLVSRFARTALQIGAVISVLYMGMVWLLPGPFISFFRFTNAQAIRDVQIYLLILGTFIFFRLSIPSSRRSSPPRETAGHPLSSAPWAWSSIWCWIRC